MLSAGPALKVTIYLNDDTDSGIGFLHEDVLALLLKRKISGATLFRPDAGFGGHQRLHTSGAGSTEGEHLPLMLIFIDSREKVEAILPELLPLITDGLVEMQPTQILRAASHPSRVIA
jgi:PII-like signaling protein